jgi:hypothetical protein
MSWQYFTGCTFFPHPLSFLHLTGNLQLTQSLWLGLCLLSCSLTATAQSPITTWQKVLGGWGFDQANAITATLDGGYVVAGYSNSINGDVMGNHGNDDYWVVKLDGSGQMLWQKALGGSDYDQANAITATSDGGYVVVGSAYSTDGDVTGNHASADLWVVKLDGSGQVLWQKTLGGSGTDIAYAITTTLEGGYMVAGSSNSINGDVTGNHGNSDFWVVKLDGSGNIIWQKNLGGSGTDIAYAITAASDGGYVVAGYTYSTDGNVTGNHGFYDYWVVKLDRSGQVLWQKTLGGSALDIAYAITASSDGGYVVAGFTYSTDGDVTGNHGEADLWVIKLDGDGHIIWQKALGGSDTDAGRAITASSDGGYVVAGSSRSANGDLSSNNGSDDLWVVKLDGGGTMLWQKVLGGPGNDTAYAVTASSDGGYVVVGATDTSDGMSNHGFVDYWVVKLGGSLASTSMYTVKAGNWTDATTWSGNRVPQSRDILRLGHAVTLPSGYSGQALRLIYSITGRLIFSPNSSFKPVSD